MRGFARRTLFATLALSLSVACSKKDDSDDDDSSNAGEEAPNVPPPGSLTIATEVGEDVASDAGGSEAAFLASTLGVAHLGATAVVTLTNTALLAQMAVPIALLKKAQTVEPSYVGDNAWVWSFDVVHGGITYTANLVGTKTSTGSGWLMQVSSDKANADGVRFEEFTFYTGAVEGDSVGSWQIYDPRVPEDGAKLYLVSYDYDSEDDKVLRYLVNSSKSSAEDWGEGSYVDYTVTSSTVTLEIKNSAQAGGPHVVTWDRSTGEGSFTNNEGSQLCWGAKPDFVDQSCLD